MPRNVGTTAVRKDGTVTASSPAFSREEVVKIVSKEMCDELKQFVELTSATSSGSAKVMSAH
jgi:hypothetical protein